MVVDGWGQSRESNNRVPHGCRCLTIDTNSRAGDINSEFDMAVVLPPLRVVPSSLRVVLLPLRVVIPRVTSTYNR